jgi:hypoxanthine phosphoribosyltransferase
VLEAFTPDFYLPDADVYVELTAMKQSRTYRKNRKVRKLQALGEVVTILYRRDLERLRERYGRRPSSLPEPPRLRRRGAAG